MAESVSHKIHCAFPKIPKDDYTAATSLQQSTGKADIVCSTLFGNTSFDSRRPTHAT